MRFHRHLGRIASALIFPHYCPSCGELWEDGAGWICPDCWTELPPAGNGIWQKEPALRGRVTAALHYGGMTRDLVHHMKYRGRDDVARKLGQKGAQTLIDRGDAGRFTAIVPVPLHPVRVRERGYDQNLCIAGSISDRLKAPVISDLICRIRNTPPQARLSDHERQANMKGAFAPTGREKPHPTGTVLLLDDVIHTGATATGCIRALNKIGITDIKVLAICG